MMSVKPVEMDIVKYMKEIISSFVLVAEQKKINLTFDSEFEEQLLWIDPKKLEKAFNNLLLNAFKFTKVNDSIDVRITRPNQKDRQDYICIEVKDTGKGIASEDMDKVFERFYQVDTNSSGTGIGLSLVKNLIELHHGAITVESELSRFTVFKVFLPVGDKYFSIEQKKSPSSSDWKQLDANVISSLIDANYSESTKTKSVSKNERILIVDDNSETLYYLNTMFDNYHTTTAQNGAKALELIRSQDFDLVISDVMMPVMDGLELCKTLKQDLSTCHIPVILLTAKSAVEHLIEGIEEGADDYIAKPFHPNVLKARVHNLIESRKQMIEKFRSNKISELHDIARNNIDQEFIQTAVNLIINNIQDPDFDVEHLCSLIGMSRSNLFRKIKAISGQNPIEFINSIRMKRAIELLTENKANISEIAFCVGFQTVSSFGKVFRKHYQMTPTEYLKSIGRNRRTFDRFGLSK
jgi:CheY-like chemotaxis protein